MARFLRREILFGNDEEDDDRAPRIRIFRDLTHPFDGLSDHEIYRRYRFPPYVILELVDLLRDDLQRPTGRSRAISPLIQVTIGLRYLATNSFQVVVGDAARSSQSSTSRCVHRFMRALIRHLNRFIRFPSMEDLDEMKAEFEEMAGFPNVVGLVDGTHVGILPPAANKEVFRNRKGVTTLNVQAVCDHRGLITHIYANWPGSAHDARVYRESNLDELMGRLAGDSWLLGDSAYRCYESLLTPIRIVDSEAKRRYNRAHRKTRVLIEQVFGRWKRRFAILLHQMRMPGPRVCAMAITCAAMLHNFATTHNLPDIEDEDAPPDDQPGGEIEQGNNRRAQAMQDRVVLEYFND